MKFYPKAIIINGEYKTNLSISLKDKTITNLSDFNREKEDFVISTAFVNAHSHLEYRGLLGKIPKLPYWEWIGELIQLKLKQDTDQVILDTLLAAQENKKAGVGLIGEISDRPYSGKALQQVGLKGVIFQEVITFFEHKDPYQKLIQIEKYQKINQDNFTGEVFLSPHTPYTVDPITLKNFGNSILPFSIHVAESYEENQFFEENKGPFVKWYKNFDFPLESPGVRVATYLDLLGLARPGAQWIHCCDINSDEIQMLAQRGVHIVHCPRSNHHLSCPIAPIKQMIDAGITVGLGMDSVASSGSINMLEEIKWAQKLSYMRNEPMSANEVWNMATQWGAKSLGVSEWDIKIGSEVPLIKIFAKDYSSFQSMIDTAYKVEWLDGE